MTTTAPTRPGPVPGAGVGAREHDELADLALLTGPAATGLVAAALVGDDAAPAGLQVTVQAVHHRPGVGVSVCYEVRHDDLPAPEVLVASTSVASRHDRTDAVAVLDDGVRTIRVWRRPDDPSLPALRAALTPATLASWLGWAEQPTVELLSYRPTRRAVVLARGSGRTAFVKIVRPRRAAALVGRHELLADSALTAPAALGEPVPGAVLLAAARGWSLAQALASGTAAIPAPEAVLAALDALPPEVARLECRPSWVDRLDFHADAARAALPDRAAAVDDVVRRVGRVLAHEPSPPTVATHGDLNVANLFVDGAIPSALIDVDSLGPGRRDDDLATLLAHLAVLPGLAPELYTGVPQVLDHWRAAFAATTSPAALDARTAAVLVSLVAGASPAQASARLDLALAHVERAERSPS